MKYIACLVLVMMGLSVKGQKIQFFGLGRAVVSNERLDGKITEGDTVNPVRSMGGYTLLDMGVRFHPFHYLKGHAIVRVKNQFGIFWGEGTSLSVRQFRFDGVASKVIRYEIGDIDIKMSPFTLFVPDIYPEENLPEIFKIRRRIQEYENFITDHQRRLQGLTFFSVLKYDREYHIFRLRALLARNQPDQLPGENRLLAGSTVTYNFKEALTMKLNVLYNFQLQQTKISNELNNFTGTVQYFYTNPVSRRVIIMLEGESGLSDHRIVHSNDSLKVSAGYFTTNECRINVNDLVVLAASYHHVSPFFYSPGAQTPLYNFYQTPSTFPFYSALYLQRSQLLFDHFTQEDIYDRSIRSNLWPYFPNYNNVFPYGISTPNRSGIFIKGKLKDKSNAAELGAEYFTGQEVKGEQVNEKRTFRMLTVLSGLEISKLSNWNKKLKIGGSFRSQLTERKGIKDTSQIYLQTRLLTLGIEVEPLKNFFLLAGFSFNNSIGNEFIPFRDITNRVYQYTVFKSDQEEQLISSGIQYKFSAHSFFTAQLNMTQQRNSAEKEPQLKILQLYLNFTASF